MPTLNLLTQPIMTEQVDLKCGQQSRTGDLANCQPMREGSPMVWKLPLHFCGGDEEEEEDDGGGDDDMVNRSRSCLRCVPSLGSRPVSASHLPH